MSSTFWQCCQSFVVSETVSCPQATRKQYVGVGLNSQRCLPMERVSNTFLRAAMSPEQTSTSMYQGPTHELDFLASTSDSILRS